MFITRKRLEEIKSATRWEYESQLNRDREIRDIHEELWELRRRLDKLEGETNDAEPVVTCVHG